MNWRERAEKVTPGGSQTRSKRRLFDYPVALQGAQYQHTWDREGNTYIDWISGLCAIGLGHGWPEVDEAVVRQVMDHGICLSLPSYLEVEVAELLLDTLGWGEQVRWVKTGSEATGGAILIADAYHAALGTNRKAVISIGYHGWHKEHLSPWVHDVPWGDLEKFKSVLNSYEGHVSCVILEPMRDDEPPAGYLEGVQQLTKGHGALFIIDEVVTGFRWAIGGASEYYRITPDLACFGKAMANGYPIAAVVGPATIMAYADRVSSTFGGECVGLAAAQATIEIYREQDVIKTIWQTGQALKDALNLDGYPCYPRLRPYVAGGPREMASHLAENGILIHPAKGTFVPTFSHTEIDVKATVKALCEP